ncbi:MAG: glycosyltransferase family 4 protein [Bacteroidales bacterium]|nr:glycosyltransferase family 4 protein [Bacteroidales bacterium]
MKIVINALSARRGGGQTYLINLLQNIDSYNGNKICFLAPDSLKIPLHPKIERIRVNWPTENPLFRAFWERYCLPGLLKKLHADILFCPGGLINTPVSKDYKTVTMFRNMIPFDRVQRAKYPYGLMRIRNWILERIMLKSMLKADLVIFISDFARQLINERTGFKLKNAVTIHHGINNIFQISEDKIPNRPQWLPEEEYLLYVSIFDVYKNQLEIVQGYHLLRQRRKTKEKLILAGHNTSRYGEKVRQEINKLNLVNEVILAGNIPYNKLADIYYHAKLNIFASECENCPNILLEALGAGRPLVVSNRQPMPEFGGDSVIYFDPSSPNDFADKIISIIDDPLKIEELSKKAKERSHHYDWCKTAGKTWKEIENMV